MLLMSLNIVATWGRLHIVAETCSSTFVSHILVQLVDSRLILCGIFKEGVQKHVIRVYFETLHKHTLWAKLNTVGMNLAVSTLNHCDLNCYLDRNTNSWQWEEQTGRVTYFGWRKETQPVENVSGGLRWTSWYSEERCTASFFPLPVEHAYQSDWY